MPRLNAVTTILLALFFLLPRAGSAAPITLFSTLGPSDGVDLDGLLVTGAAPAPASHGLRFGFQAFAPEADFVVLDELDALVFALSTDQDWTDEPGLAIYMSLFADVAGSPGGELAHAYVYWPLTDTPTLVRAGSGFPFSLPLSTSAYYWFTLSVGDGINGTFDASRHMTWHYAEGTRTPGLRLIGSLVPRPVPEPALALLVSASLAARAGWNRRRRLHQ